MVPAQLLIDSNLWHAMVREGKEAFHCFTHRATYLPTVDCYFACLPALWAIDGETPFPTVNYSNRAGVGVTGGSFYCDFQISESG